MRGRPEWPEAEFIVGNPPFIGGKDLRSRMAPGYAEALWAAHKHMNESCGFCDVLVGSGGGDFGTKRSATATLWVRDDEFH